MRIDAISDFGEYLLPIIVPLAMIAYSAEVGMTVFLSFERYLGGFHLNFYGASSEMPLGFQIQVGKQ
jgi:hypothetical protein